MEASIRRQSSLAIRITWQSTRECEYIFCLLARGPLKEFQNRQNLLQHVHAAASQQLLRAALSQTWRGLFVFVPLLIKFKIYVYVCAANSSVFNGFCPAGVAIQAECSAVA